MKGYPLVNGLTRPLARALTGLAYETFDIDSEAWLASQSITDISVRRRYSNFYKLCKSLTPTLWGRLMMVSLRSNEAPRKTWGGGKSIHASQLQGDFVTAGTVTYGTDGATMSYAANWPNRVQTPAGYAYATHRQETAPTFFGVVYKNALASGKFLNGASFVRFGTGATSSFMGNYSGGDAQVAAYQTGSSMISASSGQFINYDSSANNSVDAPQFVGFDYFPGRASIGQLSNANYVTTTNAGNWPYTNSVTTGLYFYPLLATSGTTSGLLQYIVSISGGIADITLEAKRFWEILRATLLNDYVPAIHFAMGGQSLATSYLARALQMQANTSHTVTSSLHSYGGTYISAWVGADPNAPARQSQYTGGFYNGSNGGAAEKEWPFSITKGLKKWVVWLQGESDTELRSTALVYQQQMENLLTFLRADFGTDFKIAVNLADYALGYRTGTAQGNVTLSGITGSGTAINGAWVIAAIVATTSGGEVTNANASYSWTKSGGGVMAKNGGGYWEISNSGTIYATSIESHTHPELCTWTLSNGATGTPAFSESRTGNIERVRKAQSDFVTANTGLAYSFDSRGVTRPWDVSGSGDVVHPNNAGQDLLAARAEDVITA